MDFTRLDIQDAIETMDFESGRGTDFMLMAEEYLMKLEMEKIMEEIQDEV